MRSGQRTEYLDLRGLRAQKGQLTYISNMRSALLKWVVGRLEEVSGGIAKNMGTSKRPSEDHDFRIL